VWNWFSHPSSHAERSASKQDGKLLDMPVHTIMRLKAPIHAKIRSIYIGGSNVLAFVRPATWISAIPPMRANQFDAAVLLQRLLQRVTVISLAHAQLPHSLAGSTSVPPRRPHLVVSGFVQLDLRRRGRSKCTSRRNSLVADHHHPPCSFALLGLADAGTPFFLERSCHQQKAPPTSDTAVRRVGPIRLARYRAKHVLLPRVSNVGSSRCWGNDITRAASPVNAGSQYPEDSLQHLAVVVRGAPTILATKHFGQQGFEL
jgi:hypothetical protein